MSKFWNKVYGVGALFVTISTSQIVLAEPLDEYSFQTLPPEMQLSIMDHLGTSDMLNLMRTSNQFYQLGSNHSHWKNTSLCFLYQNECKTIEEIQQTSQELSLLPGEGERKWTWKDLFFLIKKLHVTKDEFVKKQTQIERLSPPNRSLEQVAEDLWNQQKTLALSGLSTTSKLSGYAIAVPGFFGAAFGMVNLYNPILWICPPLLILDVIFIGCNVIDIQLAFALVETSCAMNKMKEGIYKQEVETQLLRFKQRTLHEYYTQFQSLPHLKIVSSQCEQHPAR
jgi:hypothetical protein